MTNYTLDIGLTPSQKGVKVYVCGQSDSHIMDWNGCNFRIKTVEGQPSRGYKIVDEALDFIREKFPTKESFVKYAGECGDGSFLTDKRKKQLSALLVEFSNGEWNVDENLADREFVINFLLKRETELETV